MNETVIKGHKTELAPTTSQIQMFRQWCGCARYIYNWALSERIEAYKADQVTLSAYAQDKQVTALKRGVDHAFLQNVPRRVLYYAVQDLDSAYKRFFERVKKGTKAPGFPRFKSRSRSTPAFSVYGTDVRIEHHRIRLPKIGWVRLKEKGYMPTSGKRVTVSERGGRWFVAINAEAQPPPSPTKHTTIFIHPGVNVWLSWQMAGGDVQSIMRPNYSAQYAERIAKTQRAIESLRKRLKRQCEGSNRHRRTMYRLQKLRRRLQVLHYRLSEKRRDSTHKLTTMLCDHTTLVFQDWDVQDMMVQDIEVPRKIEQRIKMAIADANMGEVLRQLRYKALWRGCTAIEIERDVPVSKTCSACNTVNDAFGTQKTFVCPTCGYVIDREENALANLQKAYRKLAVSQ